VLARANEHGRLHHIGVGRTHAGTHVILLVQDLLLRELTLDPTRDYEPTGAPKGPPVQDYK